MTTVELGGFIFCRGSRFLVFDHAPFSSVRGEKCEMNEDTVLVSGSVKKFESTC